MEKTEKKKLQTRRILSLKERIEVIRLAEIQRDTRALAKNFDCGRTQILTILQQKERLLREWANNGDPDRLRRRPSPFAVAINKLVVEWIHRCRCAQISISDSAIISKAYQAKKFLRYNEFRPNRRWLDRFKRRYRLDDIDLEKVDPQYGFGQSIKSMKLSDIFEDVKESLDLSIIDVKSQSKLSAESQVPVETFCNFDLSQIGSEMGQVDESKTGIEMKEVDEVIVDNDETAWQLDGFCETAMSDESTDGIKDDSQALELIKKLEEYSMLRGNYRAIGLIGQLEKLFKGELES